MSNQDLFSKITILMRMQREQLGEFRLNGAPTEQAKLLWSRTDDLLLQMLQMYKVEKKNEDCSINDASLK